MEQPKLYTPEEMAAILRVTKETIYDRIRSGAMPKRRIGRRYYFTQDDLDELLAQQ